MKFSSRLSAIATALAFLLFAAGASALPITWTIEGLTLGPDAAPVTGQFTHDSTTDVSTDVNITSAAGQKIVCLNLDFECPEREVAGTSPSYFYNISPFGFAPTGAYPLAPSPLPMTPTLTR